MRPGNRWHPRVLSVCVRFGSFLFVSMKRSSNLYTITRFGERGCAMQAGTRQVLLLFKKGASVSVEPPHDGNGELHVAFAITSNELGGWESWLENNEIAVEEKRAWELGGQRLYFRDPDRHLIELATTGTWSVY